MEEHTASAGDRDRGDREAGDRRAGDREACGREPAAAAAFGGTKQDTALAVVAAATAAVANARRVISLAGGRERAAVAAR